MNMLVSVIVFIGVLSMGSLSAAEGASVKVLEAREFIRFTTRNPRVHIVDVRPVDQYKNWGLVWKKSRIRNIPYEIGAGDFFKDDIGKDGGLQKAKRKNNAVVVLCWIGVLSASAAPELRSLGFKVIMLRSGLDSLPQYMLRGEKPPAP